MRFAPNSGSGATGVVVSLHGATRTIVTVTVTGRGPDADGAAAAGYSFGVRSAAARGGVVRRQGSIQHPSRPVGICAAVDRRPVGATGIGDNAATTVAGDACSRSGRRCCAVGWA